MISPRDLAALPGTGGGGLVWTSTPNHWRTAFEGGLTVVATIDVAETNYTRIDSWRTYTAEVRDAPDRGWLTRAFYDERAAREWCEEVRRRAWPIEVERVLLREDFEP